MNLRTTLIVFLCFCATTVLRAERVDMLKAGAKANGKTLNTKLINSTIDRLNRGGGGTLFFPAGTYLTGSIHLKSNITLEYGFGGMMQPTVFFEKGFCNFDCTVCGDVCPNGAILPLTKEQKHLTQLVPSR